MLPDTFKTRPVLVIGHRGSPLRASENSILSFRTALQEGAYGIEFDARLSQDEKVFVFHDEKVDRLTQGKGFFKNLTSKNLRLLRLKSWSAKSSLLIPFLEEVLKAFGHRCVLYVELKADQMKERDQKLAQKTMVLLEKYDLIQRSILVSFEYALIKWIKQKDQRFFTGLNFSYLKNLDLPRQDRYEYLDCLCPKFSCLNPKLMKEAAMYQLSVLTWVVNDQPSLRKALQLGVDGIATDDPKKIGSYLNKAIKP
jgi:glycerophosphoryl diester phosphodiesterase